jgi:hypothetical protein
MSGHCEHECVCCKPSNCRPIEGCGNDDCEHDTRPRPLSSALMKERERVLDDYEKWDDCHWTTQRMKEYKESLRSEQP